MGKLSRLFIIMLFLSGCSPLQQVMNTAISQTQAAWTPVPTQTAWIQTQVVTKIYTRVVVETPTPSGSACEPISNVDYSDNSKVITLLQAYVSQQPDVKTVSYAVPERLYNNTNSELVHINYTSSADSKLYSMRFIIYLNEFGWKTGIFSIDGQCWIDPPH